MELALIEKSAKHPCGRLLLFFFKKTSYLFFLNKKINI
jgi:hypothetical protein